jgi:phage gpG-like protein
MPSRGFNVKVDVFGEQILHRRMVRFEAGLIDASDAFREIITILRSSTVANFASRGVSGGSRWRDLAPSTVARKRRLGLDPRILRATHRLFNSIIGSGSPGGDEHVERIGPVSMRWGSRVPYGIYHGSGQPRSVIPYRPPVKLAETDKREIGKILQRAIVSGHGAVTRAARPKRVA